MRGHSQLATPEKQVVDSPDDRLDGKTSFELRVVRPSAPTERAAGAPPRSVRILREGVRELSLTLYPDRILLIGRGPQCDVVIPSDHVSREHARLWMREDGSWVIRDLGSRNGTYLVRGGAGPTLINRDTPLIAGDVIWFASGGEHRLVMEAAAATSPRPSTSWQSAASRNLAEAVRVCGRHQLPVFLVGPAGSGKTHLARLIHDAAQVPGQFILVNCGRLPSDPTQIRSELLGHVRGAFPGAVTNRVGKLFAADGGTLFLDDVEYLPRAAQDLLAGLLDGSGSFAPLGTPATQRIEPPSVRVMVASRRPLAQSGLQPDLCQLLAAADLIRLPTLEERKEDIPRLVDDLLRHHGSQQSLRVEMEPAAVAMLQQESWPGHIRELEAVVKAIASRQHTRRPESSRGDGVLVITAAALRAHLESRRLRLGAHPADFVPITPSQLQTPAGPNTRKRPQDMTAVDLISALEKHGRSKVLAAAELGISLNTLKDKMWKFGLLAG